MNNSLGFAITVPLFYAAAAVQNVVKSPKKKPVVLLQKKNLGVNDIPMGAYRHALESYICPSLAMFTVS